MNAKNKTYNGHKNFNHWNVNMWIWNDYNLSKEIEYRLDKGQSKMKIFNYLWAILEGSCTGDGVKYSKSAIRSALSNR